MEQNMSNKEESTSFPGEVYPTAGGGIVVSKLDEVINWARANSLWPLVFGTSCCAIEMMSTASAKYDWSRFGFEVARATPRQADVIIIAGTIVNKMAPVLKRLYDQMADPKYVIAMGALSFHLLHGFQSSFRTIGVHNGRWFALIKSVGVGYSVIVSLLFALMPVALYLKWVHN